MAERKDPVTRFLEYLRIRTVSGEGPHGAYQQASGKQNKKTNEAMGLHCNALLLTPMGWMTTGSRVAS